MVEFRLKKTLANLNNFLKKGQSGIGRKVPPMVMVPSQISEKDEIHLK